jgi:DNA modification methylase
MKDYGHPAMFPEELVERILKLFSYKSDIVLDPFNGVGTTTAVAKKLKRKYFGIDISDKYCKVAQKRIEDLKIKTELFTDEI